jgi:hypothetical protein
MSLIGAFVVALAACSVVCGASLLLSQQPRWVASWRILVAVIDRSYNTIRFQKKAR